jgi:hypothetical protein
MNEEIAGMITAFCDEKLDSDYRKLCLKVLRKLNPTSGKPNTWAAAIVYAIAQNSYMIGNRYSIILGRPKYHFTPDEIAAFFSVSAGGMQNKAKLIRDELGIRHERAEWMTPEQKNNEGYRAMMLLRRSIKLR